MAEHSGSRRINSDEADWRVLRDLKPELLDRLCRKILSEAEAVISRDMPAHERYVALYKLIQRRDDDIAICFNDLRRSTMFVRLQAMRRRGLLKPEELERFSSKLRDLLDALR